MTRRAGAGAQLPVFVTSMWAARRMAVVKWEGLREGGVAWFPDLTQPALDLSAAFVQHLIPLGSAGMILPAAVAATMFTNVALAFGGGHANASRRDTPPPNTQRFLPYRDRCSPAAVWACESASVVRASAGIRHVASTLSIRPVYPWRRRSPALSCMQPSRHRHLFSAST